MMRRPLVRMMSNETSAALSVEDLLGLDHRASGARGWSGDEAALIARCLEGDDSAFDQLVQRYQDMVFNLSYRLLGSYDESADMTQEVFLQIYRKLGSFRRDASLRTWIYRIVINRAKNRQRWWMRRVGEMTAMSLDDAEANPTCELIAPEDGLAMAPDKALERKEESQLLMRAIEQLPFSHRTILCLKEIEGLSYDEIAATLDLPLGTVKSRLARARKSLRDKLDPGLFGLVEEM